MQIIDTRHKSVGHLTRHLIPAAVCSCAARERSPYLHGAWVPGIAHDCASNTGDETDSRTNEGVDRKRRPKRVKDHLLALLVCLRHEVDLELKQQNDITHWVMFNI